MEFQIINNIYSTVFHQACYLGNVDIIRCFVESKKVNINARNIFILSIYNIFNLLIGSYSFKITKIYGIS